MAVSPYSCNWTRVHSIVTNTYDIITQTQKRAPFGLPWEVLFLRNFFSTLPVEVEVNGVEEAAKKTLYLLRNPAEAARMGKEGRNHVLKNFLITRHLEDYLRLVNSF
jgi:hypothetical protein